MEDLAVFNSDSEDSLSLPTSTKQQKLNDDVSGVSSKLNALNSLKHSLSGGGYDKLAELFRKDLISAMKLPDTESLQPEEYHLISDTWRQDWERGVQVPINPDAAKPCDVIIIKENFGMNGLYGFKLPKKLLHATADDSYKQAVHELHGTQKLAEEVCRYDLDELDLTWLSKFNDLRNDIGLESMSEWWMEKVMEEFETQCYDAIKTAEGLGMEYDEDTVCDVCRSPEVEDDNEMVFCDGCDLSVHQACYGILKIPKGSWVCRACAVGLKPRCVLCPNMGGAMKSTKDGLQWAHLCCALWIPEVTIVCSKKMEPIDNINEIPATRWNLICTVCRERSGACIQCSVKKCKTAYHVTCAYEKNFEMKLTLDEETDVQLKSYCGVHSKRRDVGENSPRKTPTSTPKKGTELTDEEKSAEKSRRLRKLIDEFYTYMTVDEVAKALDLDNELVDYIYSYWILKRKCNFNKPLLTPKVEEGDLLSKQREDSLVARLKMFIHLRQDFERVRNLCYMVTKRERIRSQLHQVKKELFFQQIKVLETENLRPGGRDFRSVVDAHRQEISIYDRPEDSLRTDRYVMSVIERTNENEEAEVKIDVCKKIKKFLPVKAKSPTKLSMSVTENPYAKPTYKNFSWVLSSQKRSHVSDDSLLDSSDTKPDCSSSNEKIRRRRRKRTSENSFVEMTGVTMEESTNNSSIVGVPNVESGDKLDENPTSNDFLLKSPEFNSTPVVKRKRGRPSKSYFESLRILAADLSKECISEATANVGVTNDSMCEVDIDVTNLTDESRVETVKADQASSGNCLDVVIKSCNDSNCEYANPTENLLTSSNLLTTGNDSNSIPVTSGDSHTSPPDTNNSSCTQQNGLPNGLLMETVSNGETVEHPKSDHCSLGIDEAETLAESKDVSLSQQLLDCGIAKMLKTNGARRGRPTDKVIQASDEEYSLKPVVKQSALSSGNPIPHQMINSASNKIQPTIDRYIQKSKNKVVTFLETSKTKLNGLVNGNEVLQGSKDTGDEDGISRSNNDQGLSPLVDELTVSKNDSSDSFLELEHLKVPCENAVGCFLVGQSETNATLSKKVNVEVLKDDVKIVGVVRSTRSNRTNGNDIAMSNDLIANQRRYSTRRSLCHKS